MTDHAAATSSKTQGLFKRLRYRHLYMLVTLGTHKNLHRAAEALHMSQPTLTRMLQEVEDAFGCSLFDRQPRGIAQHHLPILAIEDQRLLRRFPSVAGPGPDRMGQNYFIEEADGDPQEGAHDVAQLLCARQKG